MEATWIGDVKRIDEALEQDFAVLPEKGRARIIEAIKAWGVESLKSNAVREKSQDTKRVALGVRAGGECIHAVLLLEHFWVVIRFVAGTRLWPADIDLAAHQARLLVWAEGMQGKKVYACVVPLDYTEKPSLQGQVACLPLSRLCDYVAAVKQRVFEGTMPSLQDIVYNEKWEQMLVKKRLKGMKLWVDAVWDGRIADAEEIAQKQRALGYAIYITQDLADAQQYVQTRGGSDKVHFSAQAHNLLELRKQEGAFREGKMQMDLRIVAWGDDVRWTGRWRVSGDEEERGGRLSFYADMLAARDGVVVYIPPSGQMMGTMRFLRDAGLVPLEM